MENKEISNRKCCEAKSDIFDMFAIAGMTIDWGDILYGLENDLIGTKEASEYASSQLEFGDDREPVVDLAWPYISLEEAKEQVELLTGNPGEAACLLHRKRWQYALVIDAIAKSSSYEQLSGKLDGLYTRFGYDGSLRPLSQDSVFFEGDKASVVTLDYIGCCSIDKAKAILCQALNAYLIEAQCELGIASDNGISIDADGWRRNALNAIE